MANEIVIVKPEKCVGCNACIRSCPAPEANVTTKVAEGKYITSVDPNKCIACGACLESCTHGARDYIDDTDSCMAKLASNEKMIIIAAPALKTVLPNQWKGVLDWFRKKGCIVYDVSLGADICTWAHLRAIENDVVGNVMSQPCPAIVKYVETYQPTILQHNFSPIHSPMSCLAVYIKKYQRRTNPIAAISPCIAKKYEFTDTGLVDYNVTIKKLMDYFEKNDIKIPTHDEKDFSYNFDDQQGQLGGIYPRPGGLRDTLLNHDPEMNIINAEGVHTVYPQIDMYARMPDSKHPRVFDVLSCEFGCNVGPGTGTKQNIFDIRTTMTEVEREARSRMKSGGGLFNRGGEDRLFKYFDDELQLADFMRAYKGSMPTRIPSPADLEPIYLSMGKETEEERHHDCKACGYQSCREMAIAIFRKLNMPENCLVYAQKMLKVEQKELTSDNTRLADITKECTELSEKLRERLGQIDEHMDSIEQSTTKTSTRAGEVNNLLQNIIEFCSENPTMDADSVTQLVSILETTQKAFGSLDKNVARTNESSAVINQSIVDIRGLVDSINGVLSAEGTH